MEPFTLTQWVIVLLVFFLGLFLGMYFFAGGKWKRRYREEQRLREEYRVENERQYRELREENERLARDSRESESLRAAAARTPPRDRGPL